MGIAGLILGILGLICAFTPGLVFGAWLLSLAGIIISAIGMKRLKAAGQPGGVAVAGLVISIISFVVALPRLICAIALAGAIGSMGTW